MSLGRLSPPLLLQPLPRSYLSACKEVGLISHEKLHEMHKLHPVCTATTCEHSASWTVQECV